MGVNCCDICEAFDVCMDLPDSDGIGDLGPYYFERAACRFRSAEEYCRHLKSITGERL